MPEIFIDGHPVQAEPGQSVLQVALANGFYIPYFCWHPALSVAGNCRICCVQVEGRSWAEISCNLPVTEGMRILTDSDVVREQRRATLQFITLNHPVDCGICDKAGECTLQDYHYAYNGRPSISLEPKVRADKFHALSGRILLDNERCILCSRCVRFTREKSKSHALGIKRRGDESLLRAAEDHALDTDWYSDNIIDICPVGALLSRSFLYKARVWYLQPVPSVCPGCARGCAVDLWVRKPQWRLKSLAAKQNTSIMRVTPHGTPGIDGPWICNKGRDLARIFERPRALQALRKGQPVEYGVAVVAARKLVADAKRAVALVSNWGSNEQLTAFRDRLGTRFTVYIKHDHMPQSGEPVEDDFLIRADKNPNTAGAVALFGARSDRAAEFPADTDLVLVWGEGCDFTRLPRGVKIVFLNAYLQPENGHADVFLPVTIQMERPGHYTNGDGVVQAFVAAVAPPPGVADAATLFAALAASEVIPA
ncbi:MAG: (2Fe-2S)-binding protein [Burkholderiales bacterium]|nr:(2Fe-2S)-binding protein [Burkholderiales bacterium]